MEKKGTEGWVYCLSNPGLHYSDGTPLYKVGLTKRTPEERAKELHKTGVPFPFDIEFAKYVPNIFDTETKLHNILRRYHDRPNPGREFFIASLEAIRELFDLLHGKWWEPSIKEENTNQKSESEIKPKKKIRTNCRDPSLCFHDGQRIRHIIGDHEWIGIYNYSDNLLKIDGQTYKSRGKNTAPLNKFCVAHYASIGKKRHVSAWEECECEIDGKWVSTDDLPIKKSLSTD